MLNTLNASARNISACASEYGIRKLFDSEVSKVLVPGSDERISRRVAVRKYAARECRRVEPEQDRDYRASPAALQQVGPWPQRVVILRIAALLHVERETAGECQNTSARPAAEERATDPFPFLPERHFEDVANDKTMPLVLYAAGSLRTTAVPWILTTAAAAIDRLGRIIDHVRPRVG